MRNLSRLATGLALVPLVLASGAPASALAHAAISGSGSSFAAVAIDVWSQSLRSAGIVVNYNPDGSPAGQADYIAGQDDFAVSDQPFRTSADKLAGFPRSTSRLVSPISPPSPAAPRSSITCRSTAI